MKKALLLFAILMLQLQVFSQFPFHTLLPMSVSGISFGDTLLNTSAILRHAGIKKITSSQIAPGKNASRSSSITQILTPAGKIGSNLLCFHDNKSGTGFCISDTLLYDARGRLTELQSRDAKGNSYLQSKASYITDREVVFTTIAASPSQGRTDTIIEYRNFNDAGQLVRLKVERAGIVSVNATLYYNVDGFPDSIVQENSTLGTFVFKRRKKGKNKEIEVDATNTTYKWLYNSFGQCLVSSWATKNQRYSLGGSGTKYSMKAETNYHYNPDGTLSQVTEKINDKLTATISYSYSR